MTNKFVKITVGIVKTFLHPIKMIQNTLHVKTTFEKNKINNNEPPRKGFLRFASCALLTTIVPVAFFDYSPNDKKLHGFLVCLVFALAIDGASILYWESNHDRGEVIVDFKNPVGQPSRKRFFKWILLLLLFVAFVFSLYYKNRCIISGDAHISEYYIGYPVNLFFSLFFVIGAFMYGWHRTWWWAYKIQESVRKLSIDYDKEEDVDRKSLIEKSIEDIVRRALRRVGFELLIWSSYFGIIDLTLELIR